MIRRAVLFILLQISGHTSFQCIVGILGHADLIFGAVRHKCLVRHPISANSEGQYMVDGALCVSLVWAHPELMVLV